MYLCMCVCYDVLYNGYRVFPGGKVGPGVALTTDPPLVLR